MCSGGGVKGRCVVQRVEQISVAELKEEEQERIIRGTCFVVSGAAVQKKEHGPPLVGGRRQKRGVCCSVVGLWVV